MRGTVQEMEVIMSVLHPRSLAAFVTAGLLVLMPTVAAGQGRGAGRSGSAKPSPPVQAGKPAVPPRQSAKPPAAGAARGSATPAPIAVKPPLAAKLQPLLPPGMTVEAAAAGFKNLGQFVAAVHVSKNLGVPFASLRTEMVENGRSLGMA